MGKKSKWIVCVKSSSSEQWRILGYVNPQPNENKLREEINTKYAGWENYGIWQIANDIVIRSDQAPENEVIPISRVYRNNAVVKDYRDIVDGMEFISRVDQGESSVKVTIRVLATREGFCMVAQDWHQPFVIHWKKLLSTYDIK